MRFRRKRGLRRRASAALRGRHRQRIGALARIALGVGTEIAAAYAQMGDRTSTTLPLPVLDAFTLGQLVALFEHKTYCYGTLTGINSFDQWGVELGKTLAVDIERALNDGMLGANVDGSTVGLVDAIRNIRQTR